MLVNQLLVEARKRLKTIGTEALLTDAARALSTRHSEFVVFCDSDGKARGRYNEGGCRSPGYPL